MATLGRSGSDSDSGIVVAGSARVSVFDPMPEHGWGYEMGGRIGRYSGSSGTATTRFVIYETAGIGGAPEELVGRSNTFSVANVASSAGTCNLYTSAITSAPGSPTNAAVMLYSGHTYAMGYLATGADLLHQMITAANGSYNNETFYNKTGLGSNTPPNPFSASSSSIEGMLNVYIIYDPNVAPSKPTTGLAPTGTVNTLSPTFTANFVDGNTGRGDYLSQLDIELRQVGSGSLKWNSAYDATAGETSGAAMSRAYAGTALTAGISYEWRVRFADAFGAWGTWSDWTTFTVNSGGTVATPTSPTGKVETVSPTPFNAVWSHGTPLSTNAAEIRIKQGSTIVRGPYQKAVVVANGGTISFTFAETSFAALEWGKPYTVEIRGRDSGSLWSAWSNGGAFNTNAYPTVPSGLSPANGSAVSSLPLLTFTMTDSDDTTGTGLTAEVRIKNNAGALLFTRTATFDATLNKWKYQTTVTDFASFATYKWDARGYDGTLYSAYSAENTVIYGSGPVITTVQINGVAAGGATPPTNTPTITWVVSGSTQSSFRIQIYDSPYVVGATPIYDSGTVVSGVSSHTVPSGFLHNLDVYDLVITVTNTVPLQGDSIPYTFTVTFTPLTPISGFQASPIAVAGDIAGNTSAVLLGWTLPEDAPATFIETILTRNRSGDDSTFVILAKLPSIDQTTYIDYFPVTGEVYEYKAYKVAYQGTDVTEAVPASATASVDFDHTIISSAINPSSRRVALRITRSASVDHKGEQTLLFPWGEHEPTIMVSPVHYHVVLGTYLLFDTVYQSAESALEALTEMHEAFEVVCYRDERKKKVFGYLTFKEDYSELRRYILTLSITEGNFREGITEDGIS